MGLKRPTPYVPLSVAFAVGKTGTRILERYGAAGLGVWCAMLAAAKAHRPEGRVTLYHDNDWASLGLASNPPEFPLVEFLTFLGHMKQTRTTRSGRVRYVDFTRWEAWNNAAKRQDASERMSRKRDGSERTSSERKANGSRTSSEHRTRTRKETPQTPLSDGEAPTPSWRDGWEERHAAYEQGVEESRRVLERLNGEAA